MKKFTVFVLDDDKVFCDLFSVLADHEIFTSNFPDYNIVVHTFHDMKDITGAIAQIKWMEPDLVLLDYMLGMTPDACLDSLSVLLKIIPYCSDIKLMSGLYLMDIRLKLLKSTLDNTCVGFLSKPFNVSELVSVVKGSIQRKENGS